MLAISTVFYTGILIKKNNLHNKVNFNHKVGLYVFWQSYTPSILGIESFLLVKN